MRNHELVPVELIGNIAHLKHGGLHKVLSTLLRHKLVAHSSCEYNGYRLSYLGYDILALHALLARGVVSSVGNQIGVGKESDIFEALDPEGGEVVLKLHRLGRTSFRAVRRSRDYLRGKSKASWLYMSRLAAVKEFAFMRALHAHGFPTPVPIDQSRHIVVMSRIAGCPLSQLRAGSLGQSEAVYEACLSILVRLAEHGLVHCDLNEFNLMIDPVAAVAAVAAGSEADQVAVTLIDFPQMVSSSHPNAEELFQRDLKGLRKFFATKMRCPAAMRARAEASEEDEGEGEGEDGEGEGEGEQEQGQGEGQLTLAGIAESSRGRRAAAQDQQQHDQHLHLDLAAEALAALTAEEQSALETFLDGSRMALDADQHRDADQAADDEDEEEEEEGAISPDKEEAGSGVRSGSVFRCVAAAAAAAVEELEAGDSSDGHGQGDGPEQAGVTDRDNSERAAGRGRGRGRGRSALRPPHPHGSRNMTKKINKYGRIVRSERIDAAY